MATVRFSETLRNTIIKRGRDLFDKRINSLEKDIVPETIWERVISPVMEPIFKVARQLPPQYMRTAKEVYCSVQLQNANGTHTKYMRSVDIPDGVPAPHSGFPLEDGVEVGSGYGSYFSVYVPAAKLPDDMREDVLSVWRNINTVKDEQTLFISNLTKLINHYATLAPALKEWPALWDLLPSDVQERHKEISEKRKRSSAKEELDLSLDSMTGAVVRTKLANR